MATLPRRYRSRSLLSVVFLAAMLAAPLEASANPPVLEETTRVTTPDPEYTWPVAIAIDGDLMLASGVKYELNTGLTDNSTWLYQRQTNGNWTPLRRLHQYRFNEVGDEPVIQLALKNGVAVIAKDTASWIFERSGSNWVQVTSPIQTNGMDVALNGGTIIVTTGACDWSSNSYRKATNGAWQLVRQAPPEPQPPGGFCEDEDTRGDVDVASNGATSIVATTAATYSARIFEGPFGTTPVMTRITGATPEIHLGANVTIENDSAIVSGDKLFSLAPEAYRRDSIGNWVASGPLWRPDYLDAGSPATLQLSGPLAYVPTPRDRMHGDYTGSVSIFKLDVDGEYRHAARLVASDRGPNRYFGSDGAIGGRTVAVGQGSRGLMYVYELPVEFLQWATTQHTFEYSNAGDWTPLASSSSFAVVNTGTSRVYRQTSTIGNAASLWNNTDRDNESVEADLKPTAFATSAGDKWFGLVTRYTDANNYYYVTIRNNNTVLLRRMVNGVFTTLASANFTVALNRSYRVRLETIGTRLRVFIDSRLLAEASDTALDHGLVGVMMYKTRADVDNVVLSPNPRTTLATHSFGSATDSLGHWRLLGSWQHVPSSAYGQSDMTAGARAITGVIANDQVVQARMQRTGAAGSNNWFGLAARYLDEGNYYYVTLRNDNTVSLKKLVNGAIFELDSATLTIANNTWYRVRFEAISNELRVYINDVLRLEAADDSHSSGQYGPVMYKTAAVYDDILAVEP